MRRVLFGLLATLALTTGVTVVSQGVANATVYAGPITRLQPPGSGLAMNVQAFVNTTPGNAEAQAVVKFWCFVPGTTSGYKSCYIIDVGPETGRLYRKTYGDGTGPNVLLVAGPGRLNCSTDGNKDNGPDCAAAVMQQTTSWYPVLHGFYYFGQTGTTSYPTYMRPGSGGAGVWGVPSSGLHRVT